MSPDEQFSVRWASPDRCRNAMRNAVVAAIDRNVLAAHAHLSNQGCAGKEAEWITELLREEVMVPMPQWPKHDHFETRPGRRRLEPITPPPTTTQSPVMAASFENLVGIEPAARLMVPFEQSTQPVVAGYAASVP